MFDFGKHKRLAGAKSALYRLINASTPNHLPLEGGERWEDRSNRSLPVLVCPLVKQRPKTDLALLAVTKDLCTQGVSAILTHPMPAGPVVLAFWLDDEPVFFLGEPSQATALGGGFWQQGFEIERLALLGDQPELDVLLPHARRLSPRHPAELAAGAP